LLGRYVGFAIGNGNIRTGLGQGMCQNPPDPSRRACYQRDLAI
jgi:hypothetical protein